MKAELLGWRPGLEGLRGIAVLGVILHHLHATRDWLPGGALGVDLFFVLSGFLITTLLLEERSGHGGVSLAGFYKRRARRLLPALALFLVAFTAITIITSQPGAEHLPVTVTATQFYVLNLLHNFSDVVTPGADHLWSLSVEEQFYILWPVLLILAMRGNSRQLLVASVTLFAVSALSILWSGRDYWELYRGTEFRAQQLMAGAILAQLRFTGVLSASLVRRPQFRALAAASVAFLAVSLFGLIDRVDFLDYGLHTIAAVCAAVLVFAAVCAPPRFLTSGALRYVGTRSYALYLWHYPITLWIVGLGSIPDLILCITCSFAAAELSWRLVEQRGAYLYHLPGIVRGWFSRMPGGPYETAPDAAH